MRHLLDSARIDRQVGSGDKSMGDAVTLLREMEKIIFYGDSNTYGYDPRGFFGMRYPKEVRWTGIVRDRFKGKQAP